MVPSSGSTPNKVFRVYKASHSCPWPTWIAQLSLRAKLCFCGNYSPSSWLTMRYVWLLSTSDKWRNKTMKSPIQEEQKKFWFSLLPWSHALLLSSLRSIKGDQRKGGLQALLSVTFLWRICFLLVTYETSFVLTARFLWRIVYFQRHLRPWTSASKSKTELYLIFLNHFIIPPSTGQHSIPQDRIANSQTQLHEKDLSSHKTLWGSK